MESAQPILPGQVQLLNPDVWRQRFNRYEEVLRLNIFLLDHEGRVLVPPALDLSSSIVENHWGLKFLNSPFGFIAYDQGKPFLEAFTSVNGQPLHACNPFDFCLLAKRLEDAQGKIWGHLIVGPVIKDRKWPDEKYLRLAERLGISVDGFLDEIRGMTHLSSAVAEAVLSLLSEVVKHDLDSDRKKVKFNQLTDQAQELPREIVQVANQLYEDIQMDELLVMILDEAIQLSHSEGGSVMVLDKEKGELVIRVSRGLKNKLSILQSHVKIGEGIAGKVAESQEPLLIRGTVSEGGIQHLLRRPDIKTSLIVPLIAKNKSVGILNLYTRQDDPAFQNALADVSQISAFIAQVLDQK